MADLIGPLVAAIAELIVAAVQLCLHTVAMLLEALGFAAGHLSEKPRPGERRLSAKRLMIAIAPLAIAIAFLAGLILLLD